MEGRIVEKKKKKPNATHNIPTEQFINGETAVPCDPHKAKSQTRQPTRRPS